MARTVWPPVRSRHDGDADVTPGLVAVFVTAVTPFVPTEPILIGMGAAAASGQASLVTVVPVAAAGCCISDHLLYLVARALGYPCVRRLSRTRRAGASVAVVTGLLARWRAAGLVASRWLPGGGTAAALVTGATRWPLLRFLPASATGCTLWCAYATLLGYTGSTLMGDPLLGALASLVIAGAVAWLVRGRVAPVRRPPR